MKKILIAVNHSMTIFSFRLELIQALLREGYQVIVSSPYDEKIEQLINMGCEYYQLEFSRHGMNLFKELNLLNSYKKMLKQLRPDVVLSFTIKPNIYCAMACKKFDIPCIANITGLGTAVENSGVSRLITVCLYRIAFKKIHKVFFQNSENIKFFADRKIAIGKHHLLPGSGVNLQKFTPLPYPNEEVIKFVFISRIMKEKGIDQYLDAAKVIKERYNNTEFHVCGFCEDAYEGKLECLSKKGVIQYHGLIEDVREILKGCHCTIHPTYYPEGMSNVLLESCACARPIITTDRAGCREIVEDGFNGYIINQKDSIDLINKIEHFIEISHEKKTKMGQNGRTKVEREFDRDIVVNKYLIAINELD